MTQETNMRGFASMSVEVTLKEEIKKLFPNDSYSEGLRNLLDFYKENAEYVTEATDILLEAVDSTTDEEYTEKQQ